MMESLNHFKRFVHSDALFKLAIKQDTLDDLYQDFTFLVKLINQERSFKNFMLNPVFKNPLKLKLFHEVFESRLKALTLTYITLIIKKNKYKQLLFLLNCFIQQYQHHQGIVSVQAYTAIPITEALKTELKNKMQALMNKKIQIKTFTNPSLLGGYLIKVNDYQIDSSIKGRLNKLKT